MPDNSTAIVLAAFLAAALVAGLSYLTVYINRARGEKILATIHPGDLIRIESGGVDFVVVVDEVGPNGIFALEHWGYTTYRHFIPIDELPDIEIIRHEYTASC